MCTQIAKKNGQQDLHDTNAIGTVAWIFMIEVQQLIAAVVMTHTSLQSMQLFSSFDL